MEKYRGRWVKHNGVTLNIVGEYTDNFYARPHRTIYKDDQGNFYALSGVIPAADIQEVELLDREQFPKLYDPKFF